MPFPPWLAEVTFRIANITARLFETRSRDPLGTSLHKAHVEQVFVIVRLETEGGVLGFGDAPSVPFITGETADTILSVIRGHLAPALKGADIRDMHSLQKRMAAVFPHGNRSAMSAIDIAAHDALGHTLGVPVSVLLGGVPRGLLDTSRAISTGTVESAVGSARRYVQAGYRTLKIKTGADAEVEIASIRAVREAVGPDIRIKLDANQAWTLTEAVRFLEKAAPYDIYVVEQPLLAGDLAGAAELRGRTTIPVMLDEAIHGPDDTLRAIAARACDYVNIKLLKCGGLYPATQIAVIAASGGVGCQIGSLSTSIGTAAMVHLIHAHPVISLPEINWPDRLESNPASGFTVENGQASIPEGPGLGISVDENFKQGEGFA